MKTIYNKLLFLFLLVPLSVIAQETLTGSVIDKTSKQSLPGVNIVLQGTTTSTQTDFDGKFTMPKLKKGDKLIFSYVGYKNTLIVFNSQQDLMVVLEEEANQLQEVVVQTGYGSVRKKDATGSVTLITSKDFNKGAIVSADQLIAGKAPGVRITTEGGQPDAKPNIRIRGGASISIANDPLIVIDGIPIDNTNPAGVSNPFSLINPNDIESFTILKDASATAIYGSRASNGVIIITTKKGASGAPEFNYSSSFSLGYVFDENRIQMKNGPEFTKFIQQNFPVPVGTNPSTSLTNLLGIDDPNTAAIDDLSTPQIEGRILSNTDWQDQIYRNSASYDHNFSARANLFKKIPFRASLAYVNNEGLVKTNDYERYSGSIKLTPKLFTDHLKIDLNAKVLRAEKNAFDNDGVFGSALNMDPTKPVYGSSPNNRFAGYYQSTKLDTGNNRYNLDGQSNPLALLEQRRRPEITNKLLANIEFDYKLHFFPDIRAVLNIGIEASKTNLEESYSNNSLATYQFTTVAPDDPNNPDPLVTLPLDSTNNYLFNPGVHYRENQTITNKTMDAYFVYSKSLTGFIRKFDFQAGYSYQNFVNDGNKEKFRYNLVTGKREIDFDKNNINNRYFNINNLQSFFGRSNIDLLNRYLFTFTLRADGSSFFSKENRWGYFPAFGFAWKVADESFLNESKIVSDLKLRIGYGLTGQQNIAEAAKTFYPYTPIFIFGSTTSQYLPGVNTYSAKPFDNTLTWEKTATTNIGLDFGFLKRNTLSGSLDVYQRKTTDLLAVVNAQPGTALTNQFLKNTASLTNNGAELSLNFKPVVGDNFNWDLNGNISYNIGEVTRLDGNSTSILANESNIPTGTGTKIAFYPIGEQPYSALVYEQVYDQVGNPIANAYVDRNLDGVITSDDKYYVAMRPNWTYGFGTSFNYKNLDFTANFRGQLDGQTYNSRNLVAANIDRARPGQSNSLNNVLDANLPFQNILGNIPLSDYFLEDASFLRCENITIGYRFPKVYKSASLRTYVAANNVFLITKYSGQDPENFNAIDNNFYPRPTVFTFGISLDF